MDKDYSEILPESSSQLVSLNTMIPRKTRAQLEECLGWLQTSEPLHRYSLQKTVQIAIENLYEALTEYYTREDREPESEIVAVTEEEPRKEETVLNFPKKPERKPFEGYEDFANKNITIPIKKVEAGRLDSSNRPATRPFFLKNMGL